jgi:hypothetical protein
MDSVMQYCATATFEGNYFTYLCESSESWWWTVALTSQGQTAPPSGIPRFTGDNGVVTTSPPSPASNSPSAHPKSNNASAIAGGTVGGLAVLCLSGLALAFLILRYRRPAKVARLAVADKRSPALNPIPTPAELSPLSVGMRVELPMEHKVELDGAHKAELDGKPEE